MTQKSNKIVSKAVILAAGFGKRLAPLTETRPKPLIAIGGKPLLSHTLEALKIIGIKEILLIVGYKKEQIQDFYGNGESNLGLQISYLDQKEFLGTGHATQLAESFANNKQFMLIYGDLFMDPGIYQQIRLDYISGKYDGVISAKSMPDPTKWGILQVDSRNILRKLIEKPPDDRYGTLANAGVYIFSPTIFDALRQIPKSSRGEYELTDAITARINKGDKFHVFDISDSFWSDVGHPWQLLEATKYLLNKLPGEPTTKTTLPLPHLINNGGNVENFVTIHGTVVLGENSIIKSGSYLEGPIKIGKNCVIGPNAYIRPYTVLGDYCKVGNGSEIKGSIIMNHTAIPHLSYIGDSIIGEYVNFGCGSITANLRLDKQNIMMEIKGKRVNTGRRKLGTVVGDHAQLGIQVSIMPGKTIGSYAHVGSNTVIHENVPSNSIYFNRTKPSLKNRE
ncbi:bifunctional sugar-1-phosphate nucleotidylyltransferase/acetyltransferase [Candidatus Harpocratesius sp.]